jgi:RHS repeat-associated protein
MLIYSCTTVFAACASRCTGKERDTESGNDYFGARYYASTMGRFMSPDPGWSLAVDLSNPQSWNLYSYALNNPLRYIDPTGMILCDYGSSDNGGEDYEDADDEGECTSNGGSVVTDQTSITVNADGSGTCNGDCPDTASPTILSQLCASLPSGGVQGVSGAVGYLGAPTGALELVTNYRTGQVSGFAAGGISAGWNNGGISGAAYSGLVTGLNGNNSNYSGGFTTGTVSAGIPIPKVGVQVAASSSSGGLTGSLRQMIPNGQVNSLTVGVNVGLVSPPVSVTGAVTNYSNPLQLGKYWTMVTSPLDAAMFIANQACGAAGH